MSTLVSYATNDGRSVRSPSSIQRSAKSSGSAGIASSGLAGVVTQPLVVDLVGRGLWQLGAEHEPIWTHVCGHFRAEKRLQIDERGLFPLMAVENCHDLHTRLWIRHRQDRGFLHL